MKEELGAFLLVGGKGTRLAQITGDKLSKGMVTIDEEGQTTGADHAAKVFRHIGVDNVALLAKNYAEQYERFAKENGYALVLQSGETGTGGAIEEAIQEFGLNHQYLVTSVDCIFSPSDIGKLVEKHKKGTITWGVGRHNPDLLMDRYHSLLVDDGVVWGDAVLAWDERIPKEGFEMLVKGAANVIDPALYLKTARSLKRHTGSDNYDFYWDLLPYAMTQNRYAILEGKPSVINAVTFRDEFIDYGTVEQLAIARSMYRRLL